MGRLDIIKSGIKQYFKNLIEQGQQSVDILEANAEIKKIIEEVEKTNGWIPIDEAVPTDERYILISFENFSIPVIGRYKEDEKRGGYFYAGDEDVPLVKQDMFVNAWRELPERYETTEEKELGSLELSIDTLGLSTRAYNCIRRAGINSIGDLRSKTPKDLMRIRDMRVKTLDEIVQKMAKQGLELKSEK